MICFAENAFFTTRNVIIPFFVLNHHCNAETCFSSKCVHLCLSKQKKIYSCKNVLIWQMQAFFTLHLFWPRFLFSMKILQKCMFCIKYCVFQLVLSKITNFTHQTLKMQVFLFACDKRVIFFSLFKLFCPLFLSKITIPLQKRMFFFKWNIVYLRLFETKNTFYKINLIHATTDLLE